MRGGRAHDVLVGLETNRLDVEAEEIDELLELGLAVEADERELAEGAWLDATLREHALSSLHDPAARSALADALAVTEERLRSDWYRIKTSRAELEKEEAARITIRRALGVLSDPTAMARLSTLTNDASKLAPDARYVVCERLGSERYAITHKGLRVRGELAVRRARFAELPLGDFVRAFEKVEAKMFAFGNDIAALGANVGYVKKNREQLVIGLAKAQTPIAHTVASYRTALAATNAPDQAVVCVRNAPTLGSTEEAARRLREGQAALRRVGFPATPIVMGAAKSLLGFALEPGVLRFVEIHRRLEQAFGRHEILVKFSARLMPGAGSPADVVGRVIAAAAILVYQAPGAERAHARDIRGAAVALAAMVRSSDALSATAARFRDLESALVRAGISAREDVESDALECVGCPGTPDEVVATVSALLTHLAAGRRAERADVAIAVAFAKRFAL